MAEYFTKDGLAELKKKLEYLKKVKQKEVAEQLKKAASFGDFSENAAYDQAKEARAFLRGEILRLEKLIANAKVIKKKEGGDRVEIGSTVVLVSENGQDKYMIVGPEEADIAAGRLSYGSPLGKSLLKKKVQEEVKIQAAGRQIKYRIIKIE